MKGLAPLVSTDSGITPVEALTVPEREEFIVPMLTIRAHYAGIKPLPMLTLAACDALIRAVAMVLLARGVGGPAVDFDTTGNDDGRGV